MERVIELGAPSPWQRVHTSNAGGAHLGEVREHFLAMFESVGPLRRGRRRWLRVELLHEGEERMEDLLERERRYRSTLEHLNHRTIGAFMLACHRSRPPYRFDTFPNRPPRLIGFASVAT